MYLKHDAEITFTKEDGNTVRLPNDFYYDKISFKGYSFKDGIISAKIPHNSSIAACLVLVKSQIPLLLINMLNLKEKLSQSLFESPAKLFFGDDNISENDVEKIIKWCKTNGYPFEISEQTEKRANKLLPTIKSNRKVSFHIAEFICRLNEVYCSFIMYKYLVNLISQLPTTHLYTKGMDNSKKGISEFVKMNELSKTECKELFEYKYQNIVFQNTISFKNGTHFDVKTHNLFDTAFYQLALMLSVSNQELKICPLCHEYFIPNSAKQKYCDSLSCYPQKAYKRKKAAEKKKISKKEKSNLSNNDKLLL